jgi:hypothetical protein
VALCAYLMCSGNLSALRFGPLNHAQHDVGVYRRCAVRRADTLLMCCTAYVSCCVRLGDHQLRAVVEYAMLGKHIHGGLLHR